MIIVRLLVEEAMLVLSHQAGVAYLSTSSVGILDLWRGI